MGGGGGRIWNSTWILKVSYSQTYNIDLIICGSLEAIIGAVYDGYVATLSEIVQYRPIQNADP